MIMKKSQTAIEFVLLIGFVLFAFTIFFVIINYNTEDKQNQKRQVAIESVAETVKDEIDLAYNSEDGYIREFNLPETLNGLEYDLNISEDIVDVYTINSNNRVSVVIKEISGDIIKGDNIIRKINGWVKLNTNLRINSTFNHYDEIPRRYTILYENYNPEINILNPISGTGSYAIIIENLDSVNSTFTHYLIANISSSIVKIDENSTPIGAIYGRNDFGNNTYDGPYSTSGNYRYIIKLFALDREDFTLSEGYTKQELELFMKGHIMDRADIIGIYPG